MIVTFRVIAEGAGGAGSDYWTFCFFLSGDPSLTLTVRKIYAEWYLFPYAPVYRQHAW